MAKKDFLRLTINWPEDTDQAHIAAELDAREQRIRDLKAAIATAEVKKSAILERYLQ